MNIAPVPRSDVSPVTPPQIVVIPKIAESKPKPFGSNGAFSIAHATPSIARPKKSQPNMPETPTLAIAETVARTPITEITRACRNGRPLNSLATRAKLYQQITYNKTDKTRITMVKGEISVSSRRSPVNKSTTLTIPDQSRSNRKRIPFFVLEDKNCVPVASKIQHHSSFSF